MAAALPVLERRERLPVEPRSRARPLALAGGCVAVAVVSVAVLPSSIGFDPWAWLVWGREVGRLDLDTTGGPSWKPLPVVVTTVLAPLGTVAAPLAWTVAVRSAGVALLVATFRLGRRLAGTVAGAVAAAAIVLTPDGGPRFLRLFAEAHGAVLGAALLAFAGLAALDRRPRPTVWLLVGASLSRPEAWPFLIVAAVWWWRQHPGRRLEIAVAVAIVPVLWFVLDWLGSGDPFHGADVAQVDLDEPVPDRTWGAVGVVAGMVAPPVWALAAVGLGRRTTAVRALAAAAAVWSALVVGMAFVLGYAAISRFVLPAAVAVTVLAAVGLVDTIAWFRASRRWWLGAVAVAAGVLAVGPRMAGVAGIVDQVGDHQHLESSLDDVIEAAGGPVGIERCGGVAAQSTFLRPAVAWKLDRSLASVPVTLSGPGAVVARTGSAVDLALRDRPDARIVAANEAWIVVALSCQGSL